MCFNHFKLWFPIRFIFDGIYKSNHIIIPSKPHPCTEMRLTAMCAYAAFTISLIPSKREVIANYFTVTIWRMIRTFFIPLLFSTIRL